jgi:hypothetical protein
MNHGDGSFDTKVEYATGSAPRSIVAADLNGDGKPDLALDNGGERAMSILLNRGDGNFPDVIKEELTTKSQSVLSADLNGDGKGDLVVWGPESDVGILLGHGDGTFEGKVSYGGGGPVLMQLVAADVNGDGAVDIAVARDFMSSGVSVPSTSSRGRPPGPSPPPTSMATVGRTSRSRTSTRPTWP